MDNNLQRKYPDEWLAGYNARANGITNAPRDYWGERLKAWNDGFHSYPDNGPDDEFFDLVMAGNNR